MEEVESYQHILKLLENKAAVKQKIFQTTSDVFNQFKTVLHEIGLDMQADFSKKNQNVEITYSDKGDFEVQLKFSGDVLVLSMHSNVFSFPPEHEINKLKYVEEDPLRKYCGIIHIHNFLADSLKYNRSSDIGYLLGRIFINKEEHFFVDGQSQLGFLFNSFHKGKLKKQQVRKILELAIIYCMEFDLLTPPFETVRLITLEERQYMGSNSGYPTGKHMGYKFKTELDDQFLPVSRKK
ncbi:hypothetical protein SAMN05421813_11634 [Daejeonella rubra]|uniref:Uncharacterized protein n=1 Tax=Daejeonella rubra TaxID=990371 RepID=A0A1G9UDQ0_9SPHI|nr:hypothetical protein [Daejeonella rubra]SDM58059.1 hypothetical protein SAMN05421813_11634 [Daejeonella rubra]